MNKKIIKDWIAELEAFSKLSSSRHLRFPMFMESTIGDLLSPEGILCNMHMKAGLGKWLPEKAEGKILRGPVFYDNQIHSAPESVLKWVGISASTMCHIHRENADGGFEAVIKLINQWLEE